MTVTYDLRFFFDPGSGVCLWAASESARERFGYAVDLRELPLSVETIEEGERLIQQFDTSLNWADPAGPGAWSRSESAAFDASATAWLETLRAEFGATYVVFDERGRHLGASPRR